ncbi:methyltransferase [Caudoviricetes sp.]|nr:methyltransferase [Caudoviricetes sp.]UOF82731.1 methyltransferase [Caudoviricetes sp.]
MTRLELTWASHIERRPGTMDDAIVREIARSYGMLRYEKARVLDIGACFGAFSSFAIRMRAKTVTTIEPDPSNYAALRKNLLALKDDMRALFPKVTAIHGAAVRSDCEDKTTSLYLSGSKNVGRHSTVIQRGRDAIDVPIKKFSELLAENPTLIKIDCEGSEHALLSEIVEQDGIWPDSVTQVVVEFDANRVEWRDVSIPKIVNPDSGAFRTTRGWKMIYESGFNGSSWNCLGAWVR